MPQGNLPPGLEEALTRRFTKNAQGLVHVIDLDAEGIERFKEFNVTLWDWNDVWNSDDGSVVFRGAGQPAEYQAPAGDADK